jgi:methoxymalonate biosynthesis acyl carrier protein
VALLAADENADDRRGAPVNETAAALAERVCRLFVEKLDIRVPSEDTDVIEAGLLDSLALVELLFEIEREFGVALPLDNLEVENLRTPRRIGAFIQSITAIQRVTPSGDM